MHGEARRTAMPGRKRAALAAGVGALLAAGTASAEEATLSAGDTAWMLVAAAMVLLMTPGLAFFYGGLTRAQSVLNTMMMSVASLGLVGVLWTLAGYTLAFGEGGNALVGGLGNLGLEGLSGQLSGTIPATVFAAFQGAFAVIALALVSGAVVERMRFGPFLVFAGLWSVLVYGVLAHWAFGGGWLQAGGTLDFAGGVPVEMTSPGCRLMNWLM